MSGYWPLSDWWSAEGAGGGRGAGAGAACRCSDQTLTWLSGQAATRPWDSGCCRCDQPETWRESILSYYHIWDVAVKSHLICGLQSGGKIHEPLNLDAISRTHVGDVVEVGGGTDHLGPTIRIPAEKKFINQVFMRPKKNRDQTMNHFHFTRKENLKRTFRRF